MGIYPNCEKLKIKIKTQVCKYKPNNKNVIL